jgi:hypothetical protein
MILMCCLSWALSALLVHRKISPTPSNVSGSNENKGIEERFDMDDEECLEMAVTAK